MKLIIMALTAALLSGCGIAQQIAKDCSGDYEVGCKMIFGTEEDLQPQINDIENVNKEQAAQISALQAQISLNISNINLAQAELTAVNVQLLSLNQSSTTQQASILSLQNQQTSLIATIATLQAQTNSQAANISALQLQDNIVAYIDPCGDGSGFDEVVMRSKSGKLIAYFESGSNRFLSLLVSGSYRTTDTQACNFTVNGIGQLCDILGCR